MFDIATDEGYNGQLKLSLEYELNISIVNALWVFLTGELLSLQDEKLKVQYQFDDQHCYKFVQFSSI